LTAALKKLSQAVRSSSSTAALSRHNSVFNNCCTSLSKFTDAGRELTSLTIDWTV
jgi:hypothetical protein